MPTLDQLAQQGDPGTLQSEDQARKIKLKTPQELYELWERQHWLSQDVDLERDKADYAALSDEQRDHLLWNLSSFFIGEERVATQFSGLVMAYDDEQEEAFLTTQQVDEARHMQFFDRFYSEVVGYHDPEMKRRLERTREHLNEAFGKLFDESLVEAGEALIRDPRDVGAKVDFVTTYHMVIEGALALTGQYYITDYMERQGILPGFVEGFGNIARDEHRHVAFGARFLRDMAEKDGRYGDAIQRTIVECGPAADGVLRPPWYVEGETELFGYTIDETRAFAMKCLERRLKVIGLAAVA
jgi:ribonucleoside-diphosphate reductase beta chain